MKFEELTPEQIEKAKKCETREERMAFIKENGIELTDEQLESVAGDAPSAIAKTNLKKPSIRSR